MKALMISTVILLLIIAGCSKKEVKLEVFNAEAFAYDLGDGSWEVDASTRVKGFKQTEKANKYYAKISYNVDLVKPNGEIVKSIVSKIEDKMNDESFIDVPVEVQFDLDSTYQFGSYKVIFSIKDAETGKTASTSASFELQKE